MLNRLIIKNYAIIDRLEIAFDEHLNIITGETGAGKSILLGALNLILGERADTKVLYNQEDKCVVEANFALQQKELADFFEQNELDFEPNTIVRREINQNGKSRAFVNDTPVNLSLLKELGEKLVNLHSQHETLELTKSGFQMNVVDTLAKNKPLLEQYRQAFRLYKKHELALRDLITQNQNASAELDYLQYQWKELDEAKLEKDEQQELETEQNTLSNIDEIKRALLAATTLLTNGETNAIDQLNDVQSQLKNVKNYITEIAALADRLHSTQVELKDIANELGQLEDDASLDPERLEEVSQRLSLIYRLEKKHSVATIDDLLAIQDSLSERIALVDNGTEQISKLQLSLQAELKKLNELALQLHQAREKVLREFQNNVVVLLTKVGMPNATFKVEIQKSNQQILNDFGFTEIKFLFSANKGFAPQEIKEVASGGELSRLMLCIKSLIADIDDMPTLIFDEIDNGISGSVAMKVGEIMKNLSRHHQLICITHLPQIAKTADQHLYIYKEETTHRTNTRIKRLNEEERILEIAKMLSGENISEASLANAKELIYQ
jgi:DNA repair protein RecN (Recombination protein N)